MTTRRRSVRLPAPGDDVIAENSNCGIAQESPLASSSEKRSDDVVVLESKPDENANKLETEKASLPADEGESCDVSAVGESENVSSSGVVTATPGDAVQLNTAAESELDSITSSPYKRNDKTALSPSKHTDKLSFLRKFSPAKSDSSSKRRVRSVSPRPSPQRKAMSQTSPRVTPKHTVAISPSLDSWLATASQQQRHVDSSPAHMERSAADVKTPDSQSKKNFSLLAEADKSPVTGKPSSGPVVIVEDTQQFSPVKTHGASGDRPPAGEIVVETPVKEQKNDASSNAATNNMDAVKNLPPPLNFRGRLSNLKISPALFSNNSVDDAPESAGASKKQPANKSRGAPAAKGGVANKSRTKRGRRKCHVISESDVEAESLTANSVSDVIDVSSLFNCSVRLERPFKHLLSAKAAKADQADVDSNPSVKSVAVVNSGDEIGGSIKTPSSDQEASLLHSQPASKAADDDTAEHDQLVKALAHDTLTSQTDRSQAASIASSSGKSESENSAVLGRGSPNSAVSSSGEEKFLNKYVRKTGSPQKVGVFDEQVLKNALAASTQQVRVNCSDW